MSKMMTNEYFKDVVGYQGLYWISNTGKVLTKNWRNSKRTAILKPALDHKGYLRVALQKDGKLSSHRIHRLVAKAFILNPENKPQVNHINCIKTDNNTSNLEWCTAKENITHAIANGLFSFKRGPWCANITPKRGELNGGSILTDKKVLEIRNKFKPRIYTRKMLSQEYGVTENCIKDVCIRKSWKHI